ncbi:type II secretion system minor pseudopilin GspK [Hyphococcus sp.]|uniref:type II secretion system minor pseudopilin GspK n=1 Tax=Hyphococcus sp. TaxID=2038636 RepID=UPI003D124E5A
MIRRSQYRRKQKGAALLIVLLLAATLSFVALSAMELTTRAAARTVNVNARGETLWRAFAVETLTLAAVEEIASDERGIMSLDDPWATEPVELPFEEGGARVFLADGGACFNVNSLRAPYGEGGADETAAEFVRLAGHLGISEFDAAALAQTIGDWIDEDANRRPQGSEDEYYTALPSPYRTGNQFMASVSELRAVKGVTREIYGTLRPYLCALNSETPSVINVNMLSERHAPVLAAALGEAVTPQMAADLISARPPGGWVSIDVFLETPPLGDLDIENGQRFAVTSRFLIARAEIVYDTALLEMTSVIDTQGGGAKVLSRRLGAEE